MVFNALLGDSCGDGKPAAWPSEVVDQLIEGKSPAKVIREWRGITLQSVADQADPP